MDSWKQSENWYYLENRQKDDDLTDELPKGFQQIPSIIGACVTETKTSTGVIGLQPKPLKPKPNEKLTITFTLLIISSLNLFAQEDTKVVLITLDGFRWQELFTGADPLLVANNEYVHDTTDLKTRFWSENAEKRRKTLLPFIWNEVSQMGEIHGNRILGSKVNLTNSMWFSYPDIMKFSVVLQMTNVLPAMPK
ncbi:hypothetical protein Q2T40_04855 [Winogradskyella maritima]|nr:hypothetical protein [Winogradskyella maritima]